MIADDCERLHLHLVNVAQWHISDENYVAARAAIINAHHRHPMAGIWDDGTTSSSDDQYFREGGRAEAGGQTDLRIAEHYTDTAGARDDVYGLCLRLGYRFAPSIKDLKDRKLYTIKKTKHLSSARGVDWRRRRNCGDHHLVNEAQTAQGLDRGGHGRTVGHPAQALGRRRGQRPVARLARSGGSSGLCSLCRLSDPDLRQRSHAGLNKGEASNVLRRAVFFHRQGEIRDRTFENQRFRASALRLITAAIVH